nr:reverse transcriptase domain-containing protein [Tanacetum cinerariifolium]
MRTRSSSNLVGESSPNLTTPNLKRRNRRRSRQPVIFEESPVDTMADQRTMAELLRAPTEGYAEAIVVQPILAEHFELKHSLINMMTSDQFLGLEKDNPNDHIRWFNKITSIIKYKDVPNSQCFDESFYEAWNRYKDLLRACPHHGFTELHQLDTFYNALNPADQDSLNFAAGGNLLERRTQDVLKIIENKSKVRNSRNKSIVSQVKSSDVNSSSSSEIAKLTHAVNQQTSAVNTAMTAILKQFQATLPSAFVKSVEEICVTYGGAHSYYQCLASDGNTFQEFWDNIQGYISAVAVNYNQVVPLSELEKIKRINEANIKAMQAQINNVKNELRNEMKTLIQASMSNQTNELKNMMASFFQMNTASTSGSRHLPSNTIANPKGELKAITTRSGLVLDGPSIAMPPPFINLDEDERLPELISTRMTLELANRAICTPAGITRDVFVSIGKFTFPVDFVIVDYESDHRVLLILGRPFLRTARALIDVHGEEMILRDEIEYLLNHDPTKEMNSILEDSIDEGNLADPNNDLFDNDDVYNDPFDSKEDKIKESKLLIDELDPPRSSDFLPSPEYNSVLYEYFFEVDALPSTNNEDKVFNLGIFVHENIDEVTNRVAPNKNVKKISISNASLILEDFNPPLYELPFHKEVLGSKTLLSFSSKNEEKVFNPRILTSKGVHTSLLPELSHQGPKAFKFIKNFKARWRIFRSLMERTSVFWMSRISISIPHEQLNSGDRVKLSDLKQVLHGWQPMLILIYL